MAATPSAHKAQSHDLIDVNQFPAFKQCFVTMAEICEVLRVHRATIDRWIAAGEFPKPIKKSKGTRALWPSAAIRHWLAEQCQDT